MRRGFGVPWFSPALARVVLKQSQTSLSQALSHKRHKSKEDEAMRASYRTVYMESGHFDEALKFFRLYLKHNSGRSVQEVQTVVAQLEQRVR